MKNAKKDKLYKTYGLLSAVAMELIILVVMALFVGRWLDKNYSLMGLATPGLIFLAMGLWIYILLRTLAKLDKEENIKSE